MAMRKLDQRKVHYVCRRCKEPWAVIVALTRPVTQQKWNRDTREYDIQAYSGNVDKILYCMKCGTVDLRGYRHQRYLVQAYKIWSRWTRRFTPPSLQRIRAAVAAINNLREAEIFEQKKEAESGRQAGHEGEENLSAEVREPPRFVV